VGVVGYETEVFLVEHGTVEFFAKWYKKNSWCHAENHWGELPDDALVSDGGVVIASLKLGNLGRGDVDGDRLSDLFARNREKQKKEKKWVALRWFWLGPDKQEEWPDIEDSYGDPYAIHDARDTLIALRNSIRYYKEEEGCVDRRLTLFESILVPFIETYRHGVVASRGY
jgi:hypothetical protein